MSPRVPPLLGEPLPLELVNTHFVHRGEWADGLSSTGDLSAWLWRVRGRLPHPLSADDLANTTLGDLEAALTLRGALRVLVLDAVDGRPRTADAVAVVNHAIRSAPRWHELSVDAERPVPAATGSPIDIALAAIAEESVAVLHGTGAEALRACKAPGCVLLYRKDHPRRKWCSSRCSNRVRAARHYARHGSARPSGDGTG